MSNTGCDAVAWVFRHVLQELGEGVSRLFPRYCAKSHSYFSSQTHVPVSSVTLAVESKGDRRKAVLPLWAGYVH